MMYQCSPLISPLLPHTGTKQSFSDRYMGTRDNSSLESTLITLTPFISTSNWYPRLNNYIIIQARIHTSAYICMYVCAVVTVADSCYSSEVLYACFEVKIKKLIPPNKATVYAHTALSDHSLIPNSISTRLQCLHTKPGSPTAR